MHEALIFQIALDLLFQRGNVGQHVAVGDDDAFRFGGGAGGEDDFEGVFAADVFRSERRSRVTADCLVEFFEE